MTDRVRVLVGASALLVVPGLAAGAACSGRSAAALHPAASAGGWLRGHLRPRPVDRASGQERWRGGVLGSGTISWPREIAGLALMGAVAAMPPVIRALKPQADAGVVWGPAGVMAVAAFAVLPMQVLTILYVAGILAATSRRSPVTGAALAIGTITGLATGLIFYGVLAIPSDIVLTGGIVLCGNPVSGRRPGWHSGRVAAVGIEDPQELRARRVRQGLLAGAIAGDSGGLLITVSAMGLGIMMIIGPLAGAAGGAFGGAIAAADPRRSLPGGSRAAGMFVSSR